MTDLTNQWYQAIRISPVESEEETATISSMQNSIVENIDDDEKEDVGNSVDKEKSSQNSILNI